MAEILDLKAYDGKMIGLTGQAETEIDNLIKQSRAIENVTKRRAFIQGEIPNISQRLEIAAATVASDRYDEWRLDVKGGPLNGVIGEVDLEPVIKSARSLTYPLRIAAMGGLSMGQAEIRIRQSLATMLDRRIKSAARYTTLDLVNQDDDDTGCASIPKGPTTCSFCLSMAALGYVRSFKVLDEEGRQFHDHCDCDFRAGPEGHSVDLMVDGKHYKSDAINDRMNDVRQTLGIDLYDNSNEALALIQQELKRRDTNWIMWGDIPEVDSEPKELLDLIRKERSHEERTALRFSEHGYKTTFVPDERTYFDEVLGMNQTVGLADTKQGVEFKTILIAKKESTIDDYLRRAAKKENIRLVVFDAAESEYLTDVKIAEYIKNNMAKRRINEVLLIMSDNTLKLIKVAPTSPT